MDPIYTANNCSFSYPLQWGLTIFWQQDQTNANWLDALRSALEPDGIRVLNHRTMDPQTTQIAVSTKPHVSPSLIVQRVKGRLQYLVRDTQPKPCRRNFALRSFGAEERLVVERYIADQLGHHRYVDPKFQAFLETLQYADPKVDLSTASKTSHGLYWHNLHVVLVHRERWACSGNSRLTSVREMILKVGRKKGWKISRAGILPDHVHISVGCGFSDTPEDVMLCFLNNLAYVHEMKPVFQFGGFVGTFGEYDHRCVEGE